MVKQCAAPGCTRATKSPYSKYCNSHSTRAKRHGDVRQATIFEHDLKPYRAMVAEERRRSRDTGKGAEFWSLMAARWEAAVELARDTLGTYEMGVPMFYDQRRTASEIDGIAQEADVVAVVDTVIAMYLIAEFEPRRFSGHRGFLFQLVRRLRGLAEANCGTWQDYLTGKMKRVYRDIPAKATEQVAAVVVEALGSGALTFSRTIARRDEVKREQAARLLAAAGECAA